MFRTLKKHEHVVLLALFGGAFAYLLHGAITGQLFIPNRRGSGVTLEGTPAWLFVAVPPLLYACILVRHGALLPALTTRYRLLVEFGLLFAGLGTMFVAWRLHWQGHVF